MTKQEYRKLLVNAIAKSCDAWTCPADTGCPYPSVEDGCKRCASDLLEKYENMVLEEERSKWSSEVK